MSPNATKEIVLPGEFLGTAEEFVPGHGTYEDRGKIYAALMGERHVDPSDRAIRVHAVHPIPEVHDGDEVFGRVDEVKSAMVVLTVVAAANSPRTVPGAPEGTIHVSKAKEGYTESLSSEFAPGDIVRARVLQSHPTIKLTSAAPHLGVVSAHCQNCHALLALGAHDLTCPRCGNREHRKIAQSYGAVTLEARPNGPAPD